MSAETRADCPPVDDVSIVDPDVWAHLPRPRATLRYVVVVPARNESLLLPPALQALAAQRGIDADACEVLVLANNCEDDTAAAARAIAASLDGMPIHVAEATIAPPHGHVGTVRRALMDAACRRLQAVGARGSGTIFSTDADSRVDADWIAASLAAFASGADAVGGRIRTDRDADSDADAGLVRLERLDTLYRLRRSHLESLVDPDPGDPWPRHHQHFGASLAVSVDAYCRVGGLPRVPYLEDEALVAALRRDDCVVRHSPRVRVRTSGRLDGRAEVGLSWQLRQWAESKGGASMPQVADPRIEMRRWSLRRLWRSAWRRGVPPDADAWPAGGLDGVAAMDLDPRQPFGRLWERIEASHGGIEEDSRLPMDAAAGLLRTLIAEQRLGSVR